MKTAYSIWVGVGLALATLPALAQSQLTRFAYAYPTGDSASSILLIERLVPAEVRVGQPFNYEVRLTNLTSAALGNLVVTEPVPAGLNISAVDPAPAQQAGGLLWQIATLPARSTYSLKFTATEAQLAEFNACIGITFATEACATFKSVQPQLELEKTMPPEVLQCDPIPVTLLIRNPGTGVTDPAQITDELPPGLETTSGQHSLTFDIGALPPGGQKELMFQARATQTGAFTNTAQAVAGALTAQASASVRVVKPNLQVTKAAPPVRYVGRPAQFEISVTNTGDGPARDTILVDTLPAGTRFDSATNDGRHADGKVTWNLGTLAAGATQTVRVTVQTQQIGIFRNTAAAHAYCSEGAAEANLTVKGIPALLLEVVDLDDPIEVGSNETYEIIVLNQGSADGTNIVVTCTLPPELRFVGADAPVKYTADGQKITFAPLPTLAPKATAKFHLTATGTREGDVRFQVSLTADQLDTPVQETESTHVYQ